MTRDEELVERASAGEVEEAVVLVVGRGVPRIKRRQAAVQVRLGGDRAAEVGEPGVRSQGQMPDEPVAPWVAGVVP